MFMKEEYEDLLKDPDVKEWYENIIRGHQSTASVYIRSLGRFCIRNSITPAKLLSIKAKDRDSLLIKNVDTLVQQNKAGSYIASELKAVKSWLSWNSIAVTKKIKIPGANRKPSLKNETVPDQNELKKILNAADSRERTAISLVAFAGVRLEVLGNYQGSDGLTIGDIPELEVKDGQVSFKQIPTIIRIREELSKTGNSYLSFIGPEGCQYLKSYLESRITHGEKLNKDSPIIVPVRQEPHFIRTINIGDLIRSPMRLCGNTNRPYVLRSYFATQVMQAESRGFLRDWRVFMMGHKGDIEHVYTMNKNNLNGDLIEKMREAYSAALPFLETSYERKAIEDAFSASYRYMAANVFDIDEKELTGKTTEEITAIIRLHTREIKNDLLNVVLDATNTSTEEAKTMTQSELLARLYSTFNGNGDVAVKVKKKQKIVLKSETPKLLELGYEFVSSYDSEHDILREP